MIGYIQLVIVFFIALIYYKSGIQKFRNPISFSRIVKQYSNKFTTKVAHKLTIIIVTTELMSSLWMLIPHTRVVGLITGIVLQVIFLTVMITNYGRHFENGCGCFKLNAPSVITYRHILMNVSILFFLVVAWKLTDNN
ncbi:hypothetical protein KD050_07790 [Psychrobacillus sp. INOP01]|uniref:MauE/DoxX family redox-associated membrane protein n=1 Tax=Psychrobacillus sp. INOP01 TaxID=2829187 RepID=UPI001BAB3C2D|nr:hypothetical protein KD050_07790 [Psychrobacillus sp. INOP01]